MLVLITLTIPPLRKRLHRPCEWSGAGNVQSGSTCLRRAGQASERVGHNRHRVRLSQGHCLLCSRSATGHRRLPITSPHPSPFPKPSHTERSGFMVSYGKLLITQKVLEFITCWPERLIIKSEPKLSGSVWETCSHKHFTPLLIPQKKKTWSGFPGLLSLKKKWYSNTFLKFKVIRYMIYR